MNSCSADPDDTLPFGSHCLINWRNFKLNRGLRWQSQGKSTAHSTQINFCNNASAYFKKATLLQQPHSLF